MITAHGVLDGHRNTYGVVKEIAKAEPVNGCLDPIVCSFLLLELNVIFLYHRHSLIFLNLDLSVQLRHIAGFIPYLEGNRIDAVPGDCDGVPTRIVPGNIGCLPGAAAIETVVPFLQAKADHALCRVGRVYL